MAKINLKDVGWIYHTPARPKKSTNEPIVAPILSQIPLLNPEDSRDPKLDDRQSNYIKSTDSDYIALCKQGGRKNLLAFKDTTAKNDEKQLYPRCDWFYLLDNELLDQQNQQPYTYKSQVPDYMIHDIPDAEPRQRREPIQIFIDEAPKPNPSKSNTKKVCVQKSNPKTTGVTKKEIEAKKKSLKFKKQSEKQPEEPINMFSLLSNGYAAEKTK